MMITFKRIFNVIFLNENCSSCVDVCFDVIVNVIKSKRIKL